MKGVEIVRANICEREAIQDTIFIQTRDCWIFYQDIYTC